MEREPTYYAVIPANVRYDTSLTPNAKLVFGEITALSNKKGYCWATNSYFAKLYDVSKEQASRWISQLKDRGHINVSIIRDPKTKQVMERRITIVSPELASYNGDGIDADSNTPSDNPRKRGDGSKTPVDKSKYLSDEEFERFWSVVPKGRKKSKPKCRQKLATLIKNKRVTIDDAVDAMDKYRKHCQKERRETRYIKLPSTWLTQGCWEDEYEEDELEEKVTEMPKAQASESSDGYDITF